MSSLEGVKCNLKHAFLALLSKKQMRYGLNVKIDCYLCGYLHFKVKRQE